MHFVKNYTSLSYIKSHYYPFGLTMSGISSKAAGTLGNKYKFSGKELNSNEFSDNSGLELYDFQARNYDQQLGRFWGGDKRADKLVSWSPYTYCLNNPLVFVDPDGEYPIYIITRSYAPFKTFGPSFASFKGDNRGHTLDKGATYRTLASITHDTETRKTSATGGHSTSTASDGSKSAVSETTIKNRKPDGDKIDVHSYGNNAAQPGSWDIDQFTKLDVKIEGNVKKDHILNVSGTISGDDFPNQESIIYDSKGNTLWLGNYETSGDAVTGPTMNLARENEGDVNINVNVRIKVDKNGVFQGVVFQEKGKDKVISIADWNKRFKSDDNK
jgi:RHS repeat-associated protein